MSGRLDAVTLGEAMVLMLAEPGLPLVAATHYRRSVAGAEFNVAVGLSRLGHRVGWVGRLGGDAFGRVVASTLRAEGVDVSHVSTDEAPTGMLVRDCAGARPSQVVYHRRGSAGSRLAPIDVDADYVSEARVVHVSGVTGLIGESARAAAAKAMEIGRRAGALVSFDPNIRLRLGPPEFSAELLRPLAVEAHIVLASADEARLLSERDGETEAAHWFIERGARLVVIKRGAAGAWATDGSERWDQSAWPANAVDLVGAGDAFAAGFLSALLRGGDASQALAEGALVAGLCVQTPGDIEGLPMAWERDALLAGDSEVQR